LYKCDLVWLITGKGNAVGDIGELGKRQLLSQLKKDPKFRAEVLNELGLRSPAVVIRNPRIYNMLKAQRADWQEIIDLTKQSVAGTSDVKKTAAIEGVSEYLTGLDYIDVLLEAGRDPD
jgi:predicted GTPase